MTADRVDHRPAESPFRQPKAVWAVAFACVISFMGIGPGVLVTVFQLGQVLGVATLGTTFLSVPDGPGAAAWPTR